MMSSLLQKFLSLSMKAKIACAAAACTILAGGIAATVALNSDNEPVNEVVEVAEATPEPTPEPTEEPELTPEPSDEPEATPEPTVAPTTTLEPTTPAETTTLEIPSEFPTSTKTPVEDSTKDTTESPTTVVEGQVLTTVTVEPSYFDDALFIGDSRTVGIQLYGVLTGADFFCNTGMSIYSLRKANIEIEGVGKIGISDLLKTKSYGKVYVMLGINEISYSFNGTVKKYKALLDEIRETQPIIAPTMRMGRYSFINPDLLPLQDAATPPSCGILCWCRTAPGGCRQRQGSRRR